MKTILAHLEISAGLDSVLESAWLVARRFGSYIEGLHMRPGQPDVIAAGADGFVAAAPDLIAGFERDSRDRAERARSTFEAFMQQRGLGRTANADGISADWRLETSTGPSALGSWSRVFDLICLGRPTDDAVAPSMAALETALFESGRPLLVAPPKAPASIGDNVVIAWNGSTETARTLTMAMPFVLAAREVTVLTVQKGMVQGPSGAELAHNLRRHGLEVAWKDVPSSDSRGAGEAMHEEAVALGADLLVKGAYTQSRLRQMIFGGATIHLLQHATVPMLMAH
jgi:nucleotide-binding universal stress UspA family protein